MYKQEPPNAVQIEPCEGCQLACSFCGIQGIRENDSHGPLNVTGTNSKPFKLMKISTAKKIAKDIKNAGWNPRVEFAMHGEPTMNRKLSSIISIFRKYLPRSSLMLTTNGGGLIKGNITENINNLMKFGLNILLLDDYETYKISSKIIEKYKGPFEMRYYPKDNAANPHRRRKPNEHEIIITQDVSNQPGGTHGKLMNHCGCAFPLNDSMAGKRCARPFREISIRWDGSVSICCMDWRGIYKCGNVLKSSIDEIWNNKFFYAARIKLYHGERTFEPCLGCDTRSYRVGLLPDKKGKVKLSETDTYTENILTQAIAGRSYTKPVKRPWEA
uniref:Putative iron-sulfur cluster-binding domain contining protein n=1 Tax=viral metagenome TaxID=1070528 RepID=A0A6M3L1E8_9ZZZZ